MVRSEDEISGLKAQVQELRQCIKELLPYLGTVPDDVAQKWRLKLYG